MVAAAASQPYETCPDIVSVQMEFPLCGDNILQVERQAAADLILSGAMLSMSEECAKFEQEFRTYLGVPAAQFVSSGTSANMLAVMASMHPARVPRLAHGDRVAIPALCWSTSVTPFLLMGVEPVFIDVDPTTLQMDIGALRRALTADARIRCLMLVHVLGGCCDMREVTVLTREFGLICIEDTCEGMGCSWDNQKLGTFGDFGTFSTFYSHHITSIEGGFVIARDSVDTERLVTMRAHGWTRHLPCERRKELEAASDDIDGRFLFVDAGLNFRPTEISAVIGRMQLRRLDALNDARVDNIRRLRAALDGTAVTIPMTESRQQPLLAIPLSVRGAARAFSRELERRSVETRPVISGNFMRQPVLRTWATTGTSYDPLLAPGAEDVHWHALYIGLPTQRWTDEQIADLAGRITQAQASAAVSAT